jgi:hypothetical protein
MVTGFWDDCAEVSEFYVNKNFLNGGKKVSVGASDSETGIYF